MAESVDRSTNSKDCTPTMSQDPALRTRLAGAPGLGFRVSI